MGWWSRLFRPRGPEPVGRVDDARFGPLVWSEDDESWVGEYGGYRITIGYTGSATPDAELLTYAREFLGESGTVFTRALAAARVAHEAEFQRWAAEFAGLKVRTLRFGMSEQGMGCFADLIGGEPERWWRAEFDGLECLGFGFDT